MFLAASKTYRPPLSHDMAEHHSATGPREDISFARHNFDNLQSLIRVADTKAALYVTLLLFLGASTTPLGKDVIPKLRWVIGGGALASAAYLASYSIFALGFVWSLVLIRHVVTPRGARHYAKARAGHELHFYEHVVLHQDNAEYFESVRTASSDLFLRNLTDQIFELAHICKEKMRAVHAARSPVTLAFLAWVANTGFGLWITRWK